MLHEYTLFSLSLLAILFTTIVGGLAIVVLYFYIRDVTQTQHAIRRNYPVIGRFRNVFEHLGTFFRQYFYAMDREELPFNRAQRVWVYRAAKNLSLSNAFGSTHDLRQPNTPVFLNAPYPMLEDECVEARPPLIGPHCAQPYQPGSFFNISGMSYGALSHVAVTALSQGAARAKCWFNTGEGGLSPYHLKGDCDVVFQIGTAYYGVRDDQGRLDFDKLSALAERPQVKMFEIKLSQGAKPGKGGILPADKVKGEIASIRGIPEGQASVSPNRHRGINDDAALLNLIGQVKASTGKPVGIKFVLGDEQWIRGLCARIASSPVEMRPDFITLDGAEGGTGAAPQPLMDFVGLPLHVSLPMVASALRDHQLNEDIRLICSGKLIAPSAVAWALCSGADFVVSARGFMFALGCIQAMQCNKNTCPTGITTHEAKLQKGLDPTYKSVRVAHYHDNIVKSVEMIAHSCGLQNAYAFSRDNVKILSTQTHQ